MKNQQSAKQSSFSQLVGTRLHSNRSGHSRSLLLLMITLFGLLGAVSSAYSRLDLSDSSGVHWERYLGTWNALPDFDSLTPAASGDTDNFVLGLGEPADRFAYRFTGYIDVDQSGTYTFFTESDDGSKLYIGGTEVVDNDGLHGMREESGEIYLAAGRHPITVAMFEKAGGQGLKVRWQGPGVSKQIIPDSVLYQKPLEPANSNGIYWERFHGFWSLLPNFDSLTPVASGETDSFALGLGEPADRFAYRFTGYIDVQQSGIYTFFTKSDDGSKLYIRDTQVVDNDGSHGMRERSGEIYLAAGMHPITVTMFDRAGGQGLEVRWQGPGISKQIIPASVLYQDGSSSGTTLPVVILNSVSGTTSNSATVSFDIIDTGNETVNTVLNYGDNDGGDSVDNWDFSIPMAASSVGSYSTLISGLNSSTEYYYCVMVTNSAGVTQSETESFITSAEDVSSEVSRFTQGVLNVEYYLGIGGTSLSNMTEHPAYKISPDKRIQVTTTEIASNTGNEYGVRMYGYLTPTVSGNYRFWIASDDNGSFSISTSEHPVGLREVATVPNWTSSREWNKYPDDQSNETLISLEAGQRYYIEALMKEGGGGDNLAVAWSLGGSPSNREIITSEYLSVDSVVYMQDSGDDGIVSIEAEHYFTQITPNGHNWETSEEFAGYSGHCAVEVKPNSGSYYLNYADYSENSPCLDYKINFNRAGRHYVMIRGYARNGGDDSIHVGLNGERQAKAETMTSFSFGRYSWSGVNASSYYIDVPAPGEHILNVWMREDGFVFDKLVLTTNANYVIEDSTGPDESAVHGNNYGDGFEEIPIDPNASYLTFGNLTPMDDAFVRGGTYAEFEFGRHELLIVNQDANAANASEVFIKFDLTQIEDSSNGAVLELTAVDMEFNSNPVQIYLLANDNWDEDSINWNNKPRGSETLIATLNVNEKRTFVVPMGNIVEQEAAGDGYLTLLIKQNSGSQVTFGSRQSPKPPKIRTEQSLPTYVGYSSLPPENNEQFKIEYIEPAVDMYTTTGCLGETTDTVWFEDSFPSSSVIQERVYSEGGTFSWTQTTNPTPFSGNRAVRLEGDADGIRQYYFEEAFEVESVTLESNGSIYAYVYLDEDNPPETVMLQFNDGGWNYRAYWGDDTLDLGENGTDSRRRIGDLPPTGKWVKLEVRAEQLGLKGVELTGMALTINNGAATFDKVGVIQRTGTEEYDETALLIWNNFANASAAGNSAVDGSRGDCRGYLKPLYQSYVTGLFFDLSHLNDYDSITITNAELRLIPVDAPWDGTSYLLNDAMVAVKAGPERPDDWRNMDLNYFLENDVLEAEYGNFDEYVDLIPSSLKTEYTAPTATTPQTPELVFDVTTLVRRALRPENNQFMELNVFNTTGDDVNVQSFMAFHSTQGEPGKVPQLKIEYTYKDAADVPELVASGSPRPHPTIDMNVDEPADYVPFGIVAASSGVDKMGHFTYTLPIDMPVGINGMKPSVFLTYNSGNSLESELGLGWSLDAGISKIDRRLKNYTEDGEFTRKIYDESKRGFRLNGEPLRYVADYNMYVTDEDVHARITRRSLSNDANISSRTSLTVNDYWRIQYKNGLKEELRQRIKGVAPVGPFVSAKGWLLTSQEDRWGNKITYTYESVVGTFGTTSRLQYIDYAYVGTTNNSRVEFRYDETSYDHVRFAYKDGDQYRPNEYRLKEIHVKVGGNITRKYIMNYGQREEAAVPRNYLTDITIQGADDHPTVSATSTLLTLDQHYFSYLKDTVDGFVADDGYSNIPSPIAGVQVDKGEFYNTRKGWFDAGVRMFDYNNDGLLDILERSYTTIRGLNLPTPINKIYRNTGSGFEDVTGDADEARCRLPLDFVTVRLESDSSTTDEGVEMELNGHLIDINGDGFDDVVTNDRRVYINQVYGSKNYESAGSLWVENANYAIPQLEGINHNLFREANTLFEDFNGDGLVDIYRFQDERIRHQRFRIALLLNQGTNDAGTSWETAYEYKIPASDYIDPMNGNPGIWVNKKWAYQEWYNGLTDEEKRYVPPGLLLLQNVDGNGEDKTNVNGLLRDINGDGLVDYIYDDFVAAYGQGSGNINKYRKSIHLNTSVGFERWTDNDGRWINMEKPLFNYHHAGLTTTHVVQATRFVDLNSDGLLDAVYDDKRDFANRNSYINTGAGWSMNGNLVPPPIVDATYGFDMGVRLVDLNADGFVDFINSFKSTGAGHETIDSISGLNLGFRFESPRFNPKYKIEPLSTSEVLNFWERLEDGLPDLVQDVFWTISAPEDPLNGLQDVVDATNLFQQTVNSIGAAQNLFDINGDGTVDSVFTPGYVDIETFDQAGQLYRKATPKVGSGKLVKLNNRSNIFTKMHRVTSRLHETNISYGNLKDEGVVLSLATPVAGNKKESVITGLPPLHVVTSITQDIGGVDRKTKNFYGDFAYHPGKGYAFGLTFAVDDIARTVNITKRQVEKANWATFGRVNRNNVYKYGRGRYSFDRDDPIGWDQLLNPKRNAAEGGLNLVSEQELDYSVWHPYEDGFFDANHRYLLDATFTRDITARNKPYFVIPEINTTTYDPGAIMLDETSNSEGKISETEMVVLPSRFGAPMLGWTEVKTERPSFDYADPSGDNVFATSFAGSSFLDFQNYYTSSVGESWVVDRIDRSVTFSTAGLSDTRSNVSAFHYDPNQPEDNRWKLKLSGHGNPDESGTEYNDYVNQWYDYDPYGNLVFVRTANYDELLLMNDRTDITSYVKTGSLQGRAIESITHNDSRKKDEEGWTTTFANHDIHTGKPGRVTDVNGLVTTHEYDPYERVRKTVTLVGHPESQTILNSVIEDTNPNDNVAYVQRRASSGPMYVYTAFDNVGRPLKHWQPGPQWAGDGDSPNATWSQVITQYNDDGTVDRVSQPIAWSDDYVIPADKVEVANYYDFYARLSSVYGRGGVGIASYEYDANKVKVTDVNGDVTRTADYGGAGRLTQGATFGNVLELFSVDGHTKAIRTDADNDGVLEVDTAITMEYDALGRRIQLTDPSFKTIHYKSNSFGEIIEVKKNPETDDRTTIRYKRDNFGRAYETTYLGKRQQYDADGNVEVVDMNNRRERATYDVYPDPDNPGSNKYFYGFMTKGELHEEISNGRGKSWEERFTESYVPDELGRLKTVNTAIVDDTVSSEVTHNFEASRTYDLLSRLETRTYAHMEGEDPYTVDYYYSPDFRLQEIRDQGRTNVLWSSIDVNRDGFLLSEQLGSSTIVLNDPDEQGLLRKTNALNAKFDYLMTADYHYYPDRTMHTRSFNLYDGATTHETFGYDGLKQLTSVDHLYAPSGQDGLSSYLEYDYDEHSRMKVKDRIVKDDDGVISVQPLYLSYPDIE